MATPTVHRLTVPPVMPTPDDQEMARESSRTLSELMAQRRRMPPQLSFPARGRGQPELVPLPAAAAPLIAQILAQLARGHAVTVIPVHSELTTQEAADLLGVSRPHLVQMLKAKRIPYRKVGAHRRIRFCDLKDFKMTEDVARQKALDALAAQAQEIDQGY